MKTILFPTDFSECANNALTLAAFIAKKTGATLNMLHVLEVPGITVYGAGSNFATSEIPFMMGMLRATKTKMKKTLDLPFMQGIDAVHNIEVGSIYHHVLQAAKKYKADMIVMGTHGASGFHELIIGSNAEKVVRNAEIPVLSVKDKITKPKIGKIIFATDFSSETERVFPTIKNFAGFLGADIEIVKVVTMMDFETTHDSQKSINRFRNKFKNNTYHSSIYYSHTKQDGIRRFADIQHADVIALGTHGRHGLAHFFNGSISEDLVNHSSVPVFTVNFHKKAPDKKHKIRKGKKNE